MTATPNDTPPPWDQAAPIRHLVPLGAENRRSDLLAVLIEDPRPVARRLRLGEVSSSSSATAPHS